MRIIKSILLSAALCCCLQIQSIALPRASLHKTVAATPYDPVITGIVPVTVIPAGTDSQKDKNPFRKNRLGRRTVVVKEVLITTGEVLWVVTEIIVEVIIENPCLLR